METRSEIDRRLSRRHLLQSICLLTVLSLGLAAAGAGQQRSDVDQKPTADGVLQVWPPGHEMQRLDDIGRGKGIVFSPDFSAPGNRQFYEKLGFAYFEDARWLNIIEQIRLHNQRSDNKVETLILETHGTNGNGLKVQQSAWRRAPRSYISVGALQERLEPLGVRLCIIAACNSGRLFRPEIYNRLNPHPGDPLFLPPTDGIINSSPGFNPSHSRVLMARRAESNIDATSEGVSTELSLTAQTLLGLRGEPRAPVAAGTAKPRVIRFVVSNTLIQLLLHNPPVQMTASGYDNDKSHRDLSDVESDRLFEKFVRFINQIAERQYQSWHPAQANAAAAQP